MLMDLVMELLEATDKKSKERAYKRLERVGVDRRTADVMAAQFYWKGGKQDDQKQDDHC